MKILWVTSNFLHPTTKGGQIRTLEMLRRLHRRHEIHFVAFEGPDESDGLRRSIEYCSQAYPVRHRVVAPRKSAAFAWELARGMLSRVPVAVSRYSSEATRELVARLLREGCFDRAVCDFVVPAANFPGGLGGCVLFQHNVETIIWRRRAEQASRAAERLYLRGQAARMFEFERRACREAGHVVAVSAVDAGLMRSMFGVSRISEIPTGVDSAFFAPPAGVRRETDLVFAGSMDWAPNIDGVLYFAAEILPLIRRRRPGCTLTVVGRQPPAEVRALAARDPLIRVTGTVADVRPYMWGAAAAVVPLRIGGGTRLKIYEFMAAGVPVVSTEVGAEGLDVTHGSDILLAGTPAAFADACVRLLEDEALHGRLAAAGRDLVGSRFAWERVAERFEEILEGAPRPC